MKGGGFGCGGWWWLVVVGVGGVGDDGGFWGLAQTTQLCFTFY